MKSIWRHPPKPKIRIQRVLFSNLPFIHHVRSFSFLTQTLPRPKFNLLQKRYKTCPGCGATFQQEFFKQAGYLPPMVKQIEVTPEEIERIEKSTEPLTPREVKILLQKDKVLVCQRCHSFKSGKERTVSLKTNRMQFKELKEQQGGLVLLVLDLIDLPGSMIHDLSDLVGVKDLVVLLNKADLMPITTDMTKIIKYVSKEPFAKDAVDIIPVSAKTGDGMLSILKHMTDYFKKGQDCYLVGSTSSGKSTILNQLKKLIGDNAFATTSPQGGTTVGPIKIPSKSLMLAYEKLKQEEAGESISVEDTPSDNANVEPVAVEGAETGLKKEPSLIDTAGIVHEHQLIHLFGEKELSYFSPMTRITPRAIRRHSKQIFYLGGFCRVEVYLPEISVYFWIYGSNKLHIHKGRQNKVEELDTKIGKNPFMLYPPIDKCRKIPFPPLKLAAKVKYQMDQPMTYYISGAGWFKVQGASCHFKVFTPNGVGFFAIKEDFFK